MLLVGLSAFAAGAQNPPAKPDFTGTWEYFERNSPFQDRVLVIAQTGDVINMVETYVFRGDPFTQRATIYTDNRGELNLKQFSAGEPPTAVTSKSTWKKDKLFRKLNYAYMMDSRGMRYKVTVDEEQTWGLSADGKRLTINTNSKRDAPTIAPIAISTTGKAIYRRKS